MLPAVSLCSAILREAAAPFKDPAFRSSHLGQKCQTWQRAHKLPLVIKPDALPRKGEGYLASVSEFSGYDRCSEAANTLARFLERSLQAPTTGALVLGQHKNPLPCTDDDIIIFQLRGHTMLRTRTETRVDVTDLGVGGTFYCPRSTECLSRSGRESAQLRFSVKRATAAEYISFLTRSFGKMPVPYLSTPGVQIDFTRKVEEALGAAARRPDSLQNYRWYLDAVAAPRPPLAGSTVLNEPKTPFVTTAMTRSLRLARSESGMVTFAYNGKRVLISELAGALLAYIQSYEPVHVASLAERFSAVDKAEIERVLDELAREAIIYFVSEELSN